MLNHLRDCTDREIREALLSGMAHLRKMRPGQTSFDYSSLVGQVARTLVPGANSTAVMSEWSSGQPGYATNPHGKHEYEDNRRLLGAIWTLIADGSIYPRFASYQRDGYPHIIDVVVLTPRGERILDGTSEHPMHPGFISRFKGRAPTASNEVVARMEDAISCCEKFLLRAAVVMIGLAAEETLRVTHDAMVHEGRIKKGAGAFAKAKNLLTDIETATKTWPDRDERHRLTMAIAAAESIRTERNKASHPGAVVSDLSATEELLVLGGRQLPVFWELPITQAMSNGFIPS